MYIQVDTEYFRSNTSLVVFVLLFFAILFCYATELSFFTSSFIICCLPRKCHFMKIIWSSVSRREERWNLNGRPRTFSSNVFCFWRIVSVGGVMAAMSTARIWMFVLMCTCLGLALWKWRLSIRRLSVMSGARY